MCDILEIATRGEDHAYWGFYFPPLKNLQKSEVTWLVAGRFIKIEVASFDVNSHSYCRTVKILFDNYKSNFCAILMSVS